MMQGLAIHQLKNVPIFSYNCANGAIRKVGFNIACLFHIPLVNLS